MFLPWSVFILKIILALFQYLLTGAVGAILSLYSRFGGEYANSIRWSRHGGHLEMMKSLINSRRNIPNSAKLTMMMAIVASVSASLVDKWITNFISQSVRHREGNPVVESTSQFALVDSQDVFQGWSTSIRYGANVTDSIASMINDTQNIPDAVPGRTYIPRTSEFEVACEQFDIVVLGPAEPQLHLTDGGCANLTISFDEEYNFTNTTVVQRSDHRWGIAVPRSVTPLSINNVPLQLKSSRADLPYCGMDESYQRRRQLHVASGITSLPTTSTTKCVQLNGEISVLSMSTTRFYLSNALQFRDTTHDIFEDKADKLLQDMWESIQSRIRYNESSVRPTLDTTMPMEVTVAKRSIDAIICQTEAIVLRHAAPAVECLYANINTFITKQQDPIPEPMDARRNFSNNTETSALLVRQ
ncbi:hypothetical protein BGZ72_007198 [Mortierella alpina]|nr:hypothetical protein BGZ72_007198 [Mortierella alpina]